MTCSQFFAHSLQVNDPIFLDVVIQNKLLNEVKDQ